MYVYIVPFFFYFFIVSRWISTCLLIEFHTSYYLSIAVFLSPSLSLSLPPPICLALCYLTAHNPIRLIHLNNTTQWEDRCTRWTLNCDWCDWWRASGVPEGESHVSILLKPRENTPDPCHIAMDEDEHNVLRGLQATLLNNRSALSNPNIFCFWHNNFDMYM